jgi:hypothetical protein
MTEKTILYERIEEQSFTEKGAPYWDVWMVLSGVERDILQLESDHASAILHLL